MKSAQSKLAHAEPDEAPFECLLERLSPDREVAARAYESLRHKLVGYFEWRGARDPASLADETLDRTARKLKSDAARCIVDPSAFCLGVGRNVLREALRQEIREVDDPQAVLATLSASGDDPLERLEQDDEQRLDAMRQACLESCIQTLPVPEREVLHDYYVGEGSERIAGRLELAERLHMSTAALRSKVFDLRAELAQCVKGCLAESADQCASECSRQLD